MVSDPPVILAVDTSAAQCAAALLRGEAVLAYRDEATDRGQAERLFPMLEEMLRETGIGWADLGGLAACTGPGNFTGLRIAVAAVRGLAMALEVPAVGVSRFEALAARPGPVLVTLEDRRGSFFAQGFRDGVAVTEPVAADPATLGPLEPGTLCIGFRAAAVAAALGLAAGPEEVRADPGLLARIAAGRLGTAPPPAPLYLRPADARPQPEAPALLADDP